MLATPTGADVSASALAVATKRLQLHRMPDAQRARLQLIQSSATYRDARLAGMDAIVLMEVIEHLDLDRLPDLEHSVFAESRPRAWRDAPPGSPIRVEQS